MNDIIAAQLAAIVRRVYERYLASGYHTFSYWQGSTPEGRDALCDALEDFIEERYPAEWVAAWAQFAGEETVLPRDPRPSRQVEKE